MKPEPEKLPARLGIMPLGLLYLGFVVMMVAALAAGHLFKLVAWFFRWLEF